jgi:hypothetical protein
MIRFTTLNSKYEVTVQDSKFHVKKFESLNDKSNFNAVGQTRVSDTMFLEKGLVADFGSWHTSKVVSIEEV